MVSYMEQPATMNTYLFMQLIDVYIYGKTTLNNHTGLKLTIHWEGGARASQWPTAKNY